MSLALPERRHPEALRLGETAMGENGTVGVRHRSVSAPRTKQTLLAERWDWGFDDTRMSRCGLRYFVPRILVHETDALVVADSLS